MERSRLVWIVVAATLLVGVGAAWWLTAPSTGPVGRVPGQAPIVLVTIDTLRRDHVGLYGYFRDTTPNLDRLAGEAIVYDDAISTTANTTPSHLSMLTGLLLHQHGITSNATPLRNPFESAPGRRIVAEILREDGYRTGAFVSAAPLRRGTGLAAGFETYDEPVDRKRRCEETVDHALKWVDGVDGAAFFLWIHLWDPHAPNTPLEEYRALFPPDPRVGQELAAAAIDFEGIARTEDRQAIKRFLLPGKTRRKGLVIDQEGMVDLIDRYDADVRYADHCVGVLLDGLKDRDRYHESVLAVTADHGQLLGEHDHLGHGLLYEDDVRVPLIVRVPDSLNAAPRRIEGVVSLVDMMPTLLSRVTTPGAAEFLAQAQGTDALAPGWQRTFAFAQQRQEGYSLDRGTVLAAVGARWKLFYTLGKERTLYDRVADPEEQEPLEDPAANDLAGAIEAVLAINPAPRSTGGREPSLKERRELEALGYLVP